MSRSTAEALNGRFRITQPTNLDLPKMHGNDYSQINHQPDTLWKFWKKEDAILGRLAGTEANPWDAAYPGVQYVQNYPESTHMVIAPRRDAFVSPKDLSIEDTAQAAAFINKFLEPRGSQTYAGYNIGPEKDGSQMWWSWHIHLVQFGQNELEDLASKPRIVWEPWPSQIQEVMGDAFVNRLTSMDGVPPSEQVELSALDRFGFSSYGSTLLRFPSDISPRELATVMHHADVAYKGLHKDVKDIVYEKREQDGIYTKREPEEIGYLFKDYAKGHGLRDETTENLTVFGEDVLPDTLPDSPTRNSPLTLPNYSAAVLKDESGTYFLLQPHIFRKKASALSSLGIFLDYKLDTAPEREVEYHAKKARDTRLVEDINAALQTH